MLNQGTQFASLFCLYLQQTAGTVDGPNRRESFPGTEINYHALDRRKEKGKQKCTKAGVCSGRLIESTNIFIAVQQ